MNIFSLTFMEDFQNIVMDNGIVDILYVDEKEGVYALNRKLKITHLRDVPADRVPNIVRDDAAIELRKMANEYGVTFTRDTLLALLNKCEGKTFADFERAVEESSQESDDMFPGWSDEDVVRFLFAVADGRKIYA